MKIAINAADLDCSRIDGTRIYIHNLLKKFGLFNKKDRFLIYHKNNFNPQLKFPRFQNYEIIKKPFPFWWTQTRFSWEIFRENPEILWMPMHSLPYFRRPKMKTVVTIHDLAFKFFPDHFIKKDLWRLNFFTDYAVKNSDRIIAISEATRQDILKIYPTIKNEKIKVTYHGYDNNLFKKEISRNQIERAKKKYKIEFLSYIIFIGAIQPRKNIEKLLEAFELICRDGKYHSLGLVIAGSPGWLAENILKKIKRTKNVLLVDNFATEDLPGLLSGAELFVLPSLYEGFGLPVIEAMACGVPICVSDNSSLPEITKGYGKLFNAQSSQDMAKKIREILENEKLKDELKKKSLERAREFSWEKCAQETLDWLKS